MTSHSYYKDRLGFDPNELQHEPGNHHNTGTNSMKRSSSRQTHHHHQSYHHATTTSSSTASPVARISVSPGGNGTLDYHQVQREQRDRELYANGHSSSSTHHYHHHQQHHPRHSHGLTEASPAAKKAKHSSTQSQPQGGYEDALTQFKGTMSIWDHFIEDWDIMRKSAKVHSITRVVRYSFVWPLLVTCYTPSTNWIAWMLCIVTRCLLTSC